MLGQLQVEVHTLITLRSSSLRRYCEHLIRSIPTLCLGFQAFRKLNPVASLVRRRQSWIESFFSGRCSRATYTDSHTESVQLQTLIWEELDRTSPLQLALLCRYVAFLPYVHTSSKGVHHCNLSHVLRFTYIPTAGSRQKKLRED